MKLYTLTKTLAALLLVAPSSASSSSCPTLEGYDFVPLKDSHGNDIQRQGTWSVAHLAAWCSQNSNCQGFNTNGWLKHTISPPSSLVNWPSSRPCAGLYVKQACHDTWSALVTAVASDTSINYGHTAEFRLCPGVHNVNATLELNHKFLTVKCSDPAVGCILTQPPDTRMVAMMANSGPFAVTIQDMMFRELGDTIFHIDADGSLTMERIRLEGHTRLGVELHRGSLTVRDSEFEGNSEEIFRVGGHSSASATATITGSIFTNNESGNGGALQCRGSGVTCTVERSTFHGNQAHRGAIHCMEGSTCNIATSSFQNNTAVQGGANINCDGGSSCSASDCCGLQVAGITSA